MLKEFQPDPATSDVKSVKTLILLSPAIVWACSPKKIADSSKKVADSDDDQAAKKQALATDESECQPDED